MMDFFKASFHDVPCRGLDELTVVILGAVRGLWSGCGGEDAGAVCWVDCSID